VKLDPLKVEIDVILDESKQRSGVVSKQINSTVNTDTHGEWLKQDTKLLVRAAEYADSQQSPVKLTLALNEYDNVVDSHLKQLIDDWAFKNTLRPHDKPKIVRAKKNVWQGRW
jgi:hypothetical protein